MAADTLVDIFQKVGVPYSTSANVYSTTTIGASSPPVEAASVGNLPIANGMPAGPAAAGVNLIQKTQLFDNVYWTKTRASVTADAIAAPDGTLTADRLTEDGTANNTHVIANPNIAATASTSYVWSVYAKAGNRTRLRLRGATDVGFLGDLVADLLSGSVLLATGAGPTVGIINVGNGWYRLWMRLITHVGTTIVTWRVELVENNGTTPTYSGDGVSGLFLWGAQLEQSDVLNAYTAVA